MKAYFEFTDITADLANKTLKSVCKVLEHNLLASGNKILLGFPDTQYDAEKEYKTKVTIEFVEQERKK